MFGMKKILRGLSVCRESTVSKESKKESVVVEEDDEEEMYEEFKEDVTKSEAWSSDEFGDDDDDDDGGVNNESDEEINYYGGVNGEEDDDDMYLNKDEATFEMSSRHEHPSNNDRDNNNSKIISSNDNHQDQQPIIPPKTLKHNIKPGYGKDLLPVEREREPSKSLTPSHKSSNRQPTRDRNIPKKEKPVPQSDSSSIDSYEDIDHQPTNKSKRVEPTEDSEEEVNKLQCGNDGDNGDNGDDGDDGDDGDEDYEGIPSPIPEIPAKSLLHCRRPPPPPVEHVIEANEPPSQSSPAFRMQNRPLPETPKSENEMEDDEIKVSNYKREPPPKPPIEQSSELEFDDEDDIEIYEAENVNDDQNAGISHSSKTLPTPPKLSHQSLPSHPPQILPNPHYYPNSSRPIHPPPSDKHVSLPSRNSPVLESSKKYIDDKTNKASLKETESASTKQNLAPPPLKLTPETPLRVHLKPNTLKAEDKSIEREISPNRNRPKPSPKNELGSDLANKYKANKKPTKNAIKKPPVIPDSQNETNSSKVTMGMNESKKSYDGVIVDIPKSLTTLSAGKSSPILARNEADSEKIKKGSSVKSNNPQGISKEWEERSVYHPMDKQLKTPVMSATLNRRPIVKEPPKDPADLPTNKSKLGERAVNPGLLQVPLKPVLANLGFNSNFLKTMESSLKSPSIKPNPPAFKTPVDKAIKEKSKKKKENGEETNGSSVDKPTLKSDSLKSNTENMNSSKSPFKKCFKVNKEENNTRKEQKNGKNETKKGMFNYEDVEVSKDGKPLMKINRESSENNKTKNKSVTAETNQNNSAAKESLDEEEWFFNGISRSEATNKLKATKKRGAFLIRKSQTGSTRTPFSLSIYNGQRVFNLQVRRKDSGKLALGSEKADEMLFNSLHEMVSFHTETPIEIRGEMSEIITLVCSPDK